MNIITQIENDLKQALLSKNEVVKNTLRQVKTALQNASLQKGNVQSVLSDLEVIGLIRKEVQKRKDSIESFSSRPDLIDKESNEILVLEKYLPVSMSDEELDQLIVSAVVEVSATSKKQMGQVIKLVAEKAAGRVDNKTISTKVGQYLN